MSNSPPATAVQSVSVGPITAASYKFVSDQRALLLRAAVVPYILQIIIAYGLAFLDDRQSILSDTLDLFVWIIPHTIFGVAWYRVTLLGPEAAYPSIFAPIERRHYIFCAYGFVAGLIYSLPIMGVLQLTTDAKELGRAIATLLAYGLLPYILLRLSFVFPAASVDEQYRFRHSWRHTRGQGLRLFMVGLGVILPGSLIGAFLVVLGLLVSKVVAPEILSQPIGGGSTLVFAVRSLFLPILDFVLTALLISAISIAFRICTGWVPADTPARDG